MSVSIVDGPMVRRFVEDHDAFDSCIKERFTKLDVDGDGVLSFSELRNGFEGSKLVGPDVGGRYQALFDKFDSDHNGAVDLAEFHAEMREILLALARGLGGSPVQFAVEDDSLLMKILQHPINRTG